MIVDTSAIIAILRKEPEALSFSRIIQGALQPRISSASYLEVSILCDNRRQFDLSAELDSLFAEIDFLIEPVTHEQANIARTAYRRYGKGSGHLANLNFGDCFVYALAMDKNEPLLFKGDDFVHTDLKSATPTQNL